MVVRTQSIFGQVNYNIDKVKELSITKTLKKKKIVILAGLPNIIKAIKGHFQRCINGLANENNFCL
jgi:cAMP phosphodiesterase